MPNNNWYSIKAAAKPDCTEVMIYDEIGMWGVSAKQFAEDFNGIDTPEILVRINSVGGDVFDGLAIYNAIKGKAASVSVQIDGLAASISSIIMLAGKTVAIAKNAYVMIHNPYGMAMGTAEDMRKQAALLDQLTGTMAATYAEKSGQTPDAMKALMAEETWLTADEALGSGLVDCILSEDGDMPAMAAKAVLKFKPPENVKKIAAKLLDDATAKHTKEIELEKNLANAAMAATIKLRRELILDEQAMLA